MCGAAARCASSSSVLRDESASPSLSADDGAFDDLHRQFQLGRHCLDHGDLLEILLPEVGACRAHDVEQAADDLRHAVEVSGARRTLHHLVDLPEIENPGVFLGIYLFDRRHQHEIRAGLFQQAPVGLRGAGVVPQVVLVVELRGVHEDAHDDRGVLPAGALHERAVARMQGAHRGYEADTRLFRPVQFGAKFLDACKYFHLFLETSCGAKVEIPADIKKENRRKSITFVGILISNEHEKLFTIVSMTLIIPALTSCGGGPKGDMPWIVDRFDDIKVIRYEVPGFDALPLEEKELIYYLSEAAKCGRDILFDQNCPVNLPVRRTLETVYENYKGDRTTAEWKALEKYLKKVWFANGIHHHYSNDKFVPEFTEGYLLDAIETIPEEKFGSLNSLRGEVCRAIFDPALYPTKLNQKAGRRPAAHLVEQLLPQREPGRGRGVLRRHGRRRCGQPRAGLLRTELAADEG